MKPRLLIAFIAGLVVAGLIWRFGESIPIQGVSQTDLMLVVLLAAGGALLVSVLSGLAAASARRRTNRLSRDIEIFEREMTKRLQALESRGPKDQKPAGKADTEAEKRLPVRDGSELANGQNDSSRPNPTVPVLLSGFGTNGSEPDRNPEGVACDAVQPHQRDIEKALQNGKLAAWFLPIVSLPERATQYLQAIAYLAVGEQEPAAMQNWFSQARRRGLVGEIDAQMLEQCIRLARQLKRSGKKAVVICRVNRDTLSRAEWRKPLLKMLDANTTIHNRLVVEIGLSDFLKLKQEAREQLAEIRQSGYSLLLAECGDLAELRRAAESGLFDLISVDSGLIVAGGAAGGMAHLASVREKLGKNAAIIAAGVETEDIAIEMIDNDILLAQGPLFSHARPLKENLSASQGAATQGKAATVR